MIMETIDLSIRVQYYIYEKNNGYVENINYGVECAAECFY